MLQREKPADYVIATGRMETVRKFCELAAIELGWSSNNSTNGISWEGEGENEVGIRDDTGDIVIKVDKRYYRPTEVNELLGDSSKARKELGWEPKISLEEMISEMILADKNLILKERSN